MKRQQFAARRVIAALCLLISAGLSAQQIGVGTVLPAAQTPVHDPVMIRQDSTYYIFCTGFGITVWSSKDMTSWKRERSVFEQPPEWAVKTIAGYRGHTWAPDISYHNGLYYLYYAVS